MTEEQGWLTIAEAYATPRDERNKEQKPHFECRSKLADREGWYRHVRGNLGGAGGCFNAGQLHK